MCHCVDQWSTNSFLHTWTQEASKLWSQLFRMAGLSKGKLWLVSLVDQLWALVTFTILWHLNQLWALTCFIFCDARVFIHHPYRVIFTIICKRLCIILPLPISRTFGAQKPRCARSNPYTTSPWMIYSAWPKLLLNNMHWQPHWMNSAQGPPRNRTMYSLMQCFWTEISSTILFLMMPLRQVM